MDITQAEEEITSQKFQARSNLLNLHGVSVILTKSILQQVGKKTAKWFRLSRVVQRFLQKRERKGHTLE